MAEEPDQVATEVLAADTHGEGAVMFHGWLAGDALSSPRKLYTEPGFMEWLEIAAGDILHRIPGDDPLSTNADKSSIVFVRRQAYVTTCRRAQAFETEMHHPDDPTARRIHA